MWEAATSYLQVNADNLDKWGEEDFAIAVARIECHYFMNGGFFSPDDQLLRKAHHLAAIPAVAVAATVNGFASAPFTHVDGDVIATLGGAVSTLASAVTAGTPSRPPEGMATWVCSWV